MLRKHWLLLFLIVFLGIVLRIMWLGIVPPSPDWDEAALGYNAYSILHTGRDEYGKFMPVVLQSFDDYKPALYSYLIIPFLFLFDLSITAVRMPSVIAGIVTIVATFFLVKELFKRIDVALIATFLLSISPWHIQFSRIAFETNVGLMCNVLMALLFLKSFKRPWLLFFSVVLAVASVYVYQSEKVFTPLLALVLLVLYRKDLFRLPKKYLLGAVALGIILVSPMIVYLITDKNALARAKGVSVFSSADGILKQSSMRVAYDKAHHDYLGEILDNRRITFAKIIVSNYLSHMSPNWLFVTGDIARHHAPFMGLLYIWEIPFVLIGMYLLLFGKFDKRAKWLIILWFLIAPIPASITTGVPHAVRTLNFLPTYQVFTALGVLWFAEKLMKTRFEVSVLNVQFGHYVRPLIAVVFFAILGLNIFYYLDEYFIQQNYFFSPEWQYGYEETVPVVANLAPKYSHIVVSNQPPMDQSYIFFLFYLKYDPARYQQEDGENSGGFRENHSFSKYEFRPIDWSREKKSSDTLYVGRDIDFPAGKSAIKDVNYFNGEPDMRIIAP